MADNPGTKVWNKAGLAMVPEGLRSTGAVVAEADPYKLIAAATAVLEKIGNPTRGQALALVKAKLALAALRG